MPTLEIGPVGKAVAANVKQRRGSLSLRALEGKLRDLDRPILASGLLKIEHGERRVDVDDLAALAEALDVSPSRLLLPPEESEPLTAVDVAQHREVIEAAVEAVRAAVRAGLPLYGVIDHIEFMGLLTTLEGRPDMQVMHYNAYRGRGVGRPASRTANG